MGCNPVMLSIESMESHQAETGHRTAKWPIRSAEGKRRAHVRNRSGYYDKYNVGEKSRSARLSPRDDVMDDDDFFNETDWGEDDF